MTHTDSFTSSGCGLWPPPSFISLSVGACLPISLSACLEIIHRCRANCAPIHIQLRLKNYLDHASLRTHILAAGQNGDGYDNGRVIGDDSGVAGDGEVTLQWRLFWQHGQVVVTVVILKVMVVDMCFLWY